MQKVTVSLSKELVDQIDRLARQRAVDEDRSVSRSELVSEAIEKYLARKDNHNGE